MTLWKKIGSFTPIALGLVLAHSRDAEACGGCFVPPEENTQVTGHRMIMSIGMDQATLYDQIEYTGAPESFAWVLPTKGKVDVGVSSDLLFNQLGFDSAVTIAPPPLDCPSYNCFNGAPTADGAESAAGSGGGNDKGVNVIAQEVVGPYETVQLEATDPGALQQWLGDHGYNLPEEIEPIVKAYVNDGFNFLAIKLVPGEGVSAMQPIRITTTGSNVVLPLRMVAAGTGATTTVTLYVLSEFRAETANFPNFLIAPEQVIWDYDQSRSNYTDLRSVGYQDSKGFGWLTESSQSYSALGLRSQIQNAVDFLGPEQSGYGEDWQAASKAAAEDMDTLFAGIEENSVWLTRLRAELSKAALGTDLVLQSAAQQQEVQRFIQTTKFVGTQPECPPPPPGCEEESTTGTGSTDPAAGDDFWSSVVRDNNGEGGACTMSQARYSDAAFGAAMGLLGVALYRRRRG
jgi:hypothetical protein